MTPEPTIHVVDDDARVREAIVGLIEASGRRAKAYARMEDYLSAPMDDAPACLVLDVHLPDANGLDFQQAARGDYPCVVFITGRGDIPSSVRAIRHGAIDYLTKPFQDEDLLRAIDLALALDAERWALRRELRDLQERLATLSPREREVLPLIVSGMLNKQAAGVLGISEVTFQIHRGKVMQKMRAGSLAELVRMADRLGVRTQTLAGSAR